MVNADLRAYEVLNRIIDVDSPEIAEIGVYTGDMSSRLLKHQKLRLTMVDPWGKHTGDSYVKSGDAYALHSEEQWAEVKKRAMDAVRFDKDRIEVFEGVSDDAAKHFHGKLFDLVFIDGDHSYEQTKKDIDAWYLLVKPGGYIGGHDYRNDKTYGVIPAVDEFIARTGLKLELGKNHCWFARNPT